MRRPKHKRALRETEFADDEMGDLKHKQRKSKPPTNYDDIIVSHYRGQPWQRVVKSKWQKAR